MQSMVMHCKLHAYENVILNVHSCVWVSICAGMHVCRYGDVHLCTCTLPYLSTCKYSKVVMMSSSLIDVHCKHMHVSECR